MGISTNISTFDIKRGIYQFRLPSIETAFHSHPALEVISSSTGGISLEIHNEKFENASFIIIDSNISHSVLASKATIELLMLECNLALFQNKLSQYSIKLDSGIYVETDCRDRSTLLAEFCSWQDQQLTRYDPRVEICLQYLASSHADYGEMISVLTSATHLSESRISHLFKDEMGISLKKYMVWNRLKRAFVKVVSEKKNMYEAAIESGFYDQPHLSKAFKQMLGISPSQIYNSRTLQV